MRGIARRLNKTLAAHAAALPVRAGQRRAGHAYAGSQEAKLGQGRDDKALVQFHYDLSNDFYALFLDPERVYSCAYFPDWDADIATAQQAKLEMICRKPCGCNRGAHARYRLRLGRIGLPCGAAFRRAGAWRDALQAQHDFALEKVKRLGLEDRVTIELRDFRDLAGMEFDKDASIGMFEHVGLENRAGYFRQIRALLKPRGIYLHHAITRPMKKTERDFRKKRPEYSAIINYVFPGSAAWTISAAPSMRWRPAASRCMTSKAGASITAVPAGSGRNGEAMPIVPRRRPRSARRRRGCGCSISPAFAWVSSAARSAFSRRWRRSGRAAPPVCCRHAGIFTHDRGCIPRGDRG